MFMKLYFYYGVMGSSKTANALMKKFNFEEPGRKVLLINPSVDTRYGEKLVKSRMGLECEALLIGKEDTVLDVVKNEGDFDTIIVDEAQFLTASQVDELRKMADNGIMVMCYGLKTDYMGNLFEGSKRLIEICDTIREIQSMCSKCSKKAIINARYNGDKIIYDGKQIDIGGNDKYMALCYNCWSKGKA